MKQIGYNIYKRMAAVATSLLLALSLLPSCSEDEGGGPGEDTDKLYTLTISLNSSTSYTPVTKADPPEWADEADVYERKIEKCWVVLFDENGTCVASVNTDQFILNGDDWDNATEVSQATVQLPVGRYAGYAFANLDNLATESQDIISLLEGDLTEITKEKLNTTVSLIAPENFTLVEGGCSIPMSSYETDIKVVENTENTARIVLFRMIGKVEILIKDETNNDEPKILKSLSMGNFRNGPIHLIPYSEGTNNLNNIDVTVQDLLQPAFDLVHDDASVGCYSHEVVLPETGDEIDDAGKTYTFYAFETGTESNADATLSISIGINNRPISVKPTDFSFMRRNDWLKIPMAITNIESYIRFKNMRMPIGGLPYEIVYGENDGIQILVDAVNVVDPDYTGPIQIEVEVKSVNSTIIPSILYTNTTTTGSDRSTAILTDNTDGLLIDKETGVPEANDKSFEVKASPDDSNNKSKAYFEVWTQELANNAEATIKLTLIAEYGETEPKSRIDIPYTIRIQNYKATGGN